jgi:hypothetical protein
MIETANRATKPSPPTHKTNSYLTQASIAQKMQMQRYMVWRGRPEESNIPDEVVSTNLKTL